MRFSSSCLLALGLFKKKIPQETVIKNKDNKISQSLDIFNIWVRVKTHSVPSAARRCSSCQCRHRAIVSMDADAEPKGKYLRRAQWWCWPLRRYYDHIDHPQKKASPEALTFLLSIN
jgi:hypothetical protein